MLNINQSTNNETIQAMYFNQSFDETHRLLTAKVWDQISSI